MGEPVPWICEECWYPIPNNERPVTQAIYNPHTKKIRWRRWHAGHAPARLLKERR